MTTIPSTAPPARLQRVSLYALCVGALLSLGAAGCSGNDAVGIGGVGGGGIDGGDEDNNDGGDDRNNANNDSMDAGGDEDNNDGADVSAEPDVVQEVIEETPCERDADCPEDELCRLTREQDSLNAACGPPLDDTDPPGVACGRDEDCASGLCQEGFCAQACLGDEDCDEGLSCQERVVQLEGDNTEATLCVPPPEDDCARDEDCLDPSLCVGRRRPDRVDFICGELLEGGAPDNAECTEDSDCGRELCLDGACVVPCQVVTDCEEGQFCVPTLAEVEQGEVSVNVCAEPEPCEAPSQCDEGQTCFVRPVGEESVETICQAPNDDGRAQGDACLTDDDCEANLCLQELLGAVCSHPCVNDEDCPREGDDCRERDLRGTQASRTRVCTPPPPAGCVTDEDCPEDEACRVVVNQGGDALIAVCGPRIGDGDPGDDCEEDNECANDLCLEGHCSAPCVGRDACGDEQACQTQTVERERGDDAVTGELDLCRTLPEVLCRNNAACSDDDRVCGVIDFNADPVEQRCTFPSPQGGDVGDPCDGNLSRNDQCFSRLCLRNVSDACTEACIGDEDCAEVPGGYICSEFSFAGERLRLCADGCAQDSECSREGQLCGLARNEGDDRFDFVCRNVMGEDPVGADCSGQSFDCDHGICLIRGEERRCTQPCVSDEDCPEALPVCGTANIVRPGGEESQQLPVCTER